MIILSHLICPEGCVMMRKERAGSRTRVGVAIICRNNWKVQDLNVTDSLKFESVWCQITTPNSEYYVASICHPPDPVYDPVDLLEYSRLPITRTVKGNRKRFELSGVRVIGSSKKIAGSKEKNSFYCIVNILITFNCKKCQVKIKRYF